jgi:hypothetical protein
MMNSIANGDHIWLQIQQENCFDLKKLFKSVLTLSKPTIIKKKKLTFLK